MQARARSRHCRNAPYNLWISGLFGRRGGRSADQARPAHGAHFRDVVVDPAARILDERLGMVGVAHERVLAAELGELPAEVGGDPVERARVDAVPAPPAACAVRRGRATRTASGRPRPSRRCRRAATGPSPAPPSGRRSRAWPARSGTGDCGSARGPKARKQDQPYRAKRDNQHSSVHAGPPATIAATALGHATIRVAHCQSAGMGRRRSRRAVSPARPGVARGRPAARTGARPARS